MRIRGWGWVLPALIVLGGGAWGCAGASGDAESSSGEWEDPHGGQTGSLQPCSTPAFSPDLSQPTVPTGDAAVVFHTGCTSDTLFKITDANGEPVPFEFEALDDGVVLLQTDETLTAGTYFVETPDGSVKAVTVTEPAPIPTELGSLTRASGSCGPLFTLFFDPAVLPYLPLMRLEYAVDGGERQVWFEYGTIVLSDGVAWLQLLDLDHGQHEIEVFGMIAGEEMGPDAAVLNFSFEGCGSDEEGDRTFSCALAEGSAGASPPLGASLLVLLGSVFVLTRRRRGRSAPAVSADPGARADRS